MSIVSAPFERTTSYGRGTAEGPDAILEASRQVEYWDEWSRQEPFRLGIVGEPLVEVDGTPDEVLARIRHLVHDRLAQDRFVVTLGGEHTVTVGALQGVREHFGAVGVVQFDAHADLREEYEDSPLSHACVMKRALDAGHSTVAVGIRALCAEEQSLIDRESLAVIWGWQLDGAMARFDRFLERLPETVYLTFDLDFFDPSIMPATGTPVPGGGLWYPTLELLDLLFRRKRVVAMDIVELAPRPDLHGCDFLAASLLYKSLGLWQRYRR